MLHGRQTKNEPRSSVLDDSNAVKLSSRIHGITRQVRFTEPIIRLKETVGIVSQVKRKQIRVLLYGS